MSESRLEAASSAPMERTTGAASSPSTRRVRAGFEPPKAVVEKPPAAVDIVASWRRLPEDPVSSAHWIFRWGKRFHRFDWTSFSASALILVAIVGGAHVASRTIGKGLDFALAMVAFAMGSAASIFGAWKFRRSDSERHASLPTMASPFEAIPVTLEIRRKGRLTGRETGWVSFTDGWLVYEGVRTDFSLKPQDVFGFCRLYEATELDLMDNRRVRLSPVESEEASETPAKKEARDRLERSVAQWQKGVNPPGRSILPPRAQHPEVVGRAIGYRIALCVASLMMAYGGLRSGRIDWALVFVLVAALCLIWIFWRNGVFRRELPSMIH